MIFSARNKLVKPKNSMTEVSDTLRHKIFALFSRKFIENRPTHGYGVEKLKNETTYVEMALGILGYEYKLPIDYGFATKENAESLQKIINTCQWYTVFDFVELIIRWKSDESTRNELNTILEEEMSPYRVFEDKVIPISNGFELAQISSAIEPTSDKFCSVQESLKQAIEQFSKRPIPDYNGSITSAITAVESVSKIIQGNNDTTLGRSIEAIKNKIGLHEDLVKAIQKLYHWTCEEHGKRHGGAEYVHSDNAEAKFMLVICSSIINFLIEKSVVLKSDGR